VAHHLGRRPGSKTTGTITTPSGDAVATFCRGRRSRGVGAQVAERWPRPRPHGGGGVDLVAAV